MISGLFDGSKKPRLALGQSPGAFALPEGGISPLYLILEVTNRGGSEAGIRWVYVALRSGTRITPAESLEGDRTLPFVLESGGSARFWVRAKALAENSKSAGYTGSPRAKLVVEDTLGNAHEKSFKLLVDKYLNLKDE